MRIEAQTVLVDGAVGPIEVIVEAPAPPRGIALVGHPHPLFGGTNTNKVAQTLARTMTQLGYVALRPAFRGTGRTAGTHDEGRGETEDQLAVLAWARATYGELPLVLAGFSFGAYVSAKVATHLAAAGTPALRLVLVGTAAGYVESTRHYDTEAVPHDTIVIHGSDDTLVPLSNVFAWAQPNDLPVVVVPGADHFFHRRLHLIRDIITRAWRH